MHYVRSAHRNTMNMIKILIVEDDRTQNEVLSNFLRKEGYAVISACNLQEAEQRFDPTIDLVILDVMLPDGSGLDFLHNIRLISNVPVIVLTALDDDYTKLNTFELKADEYVDKPVSPLVMTKRVNVFVERIYGAKSIFRIGDFVFDFNKYIVTDQTGTEISLTHKEMGIIRFLFDNNGNAVTREAIITNLWGCDYGADDRAIDTHIKNIRKKLDSSLIVTVKGIGYRLNM